MGLETTGGYRLQGVRGYEGLEATGGWRLQGVRGYRGFDTTGGWKLQGLRGFRGLEATGLAGFNIVSSSNVGSPSNMQHQVSYTVVPSKFPLLCT